MEKRGMSHIEMMLSFLIFAGFLIFAFYFFNPARTHRLIDSSMDYTFREIKKNTGVEVESYSISMDVTGGGIKKINLGVNKNVRVEDRDGNLVDSRRDGNSGNVDFDSNEVLYNGDATKGFAVFKFSEDFGQGTLAPGGGQINTFTIISSDKMRYISEKRMRNLERDYLMNDDKYREIKKGFNLPDRVNFGFRLEFDDDTIPDIDARRDIPEGIHIDSDVERVEVLREEDGSVVFADLIVRIW